MCASEKPLDEKGLPSANTFLKHFMEQVGETPGAAPDIYDVAPLSAKEGLMMLQSVKIFLKDEGGDAVTWLVVIIIGVIISVTIWKYIGGGVKDAAQDMGNALSGN